MPHIRIRGTKESTVAELSTTAATMASLISTSADNFTYEHIQTQFFQDGILGQGNPFVEVLWFKRTQDVKIALANFITKTIKEIESHEYITVIFTELEENSYFENGEHF